MHLALTLVSALQIVSVFAPPQSTKPLTIPTKDKSPNSATLPTSVSTNAASPPTIPTRDEASNSPTNVSVNVQSESPTTISTEKESTSNSSTERNVTMNSELPPTNSAGGNSTDLNPKSTISPKSGDAKAPKLPTGAIVTLNSLRYNVEGIAVLLNETFLLTTRFPLILSDPKYKCVLMETNHSVFAAMPLEDGNCYRIKKLHASDSTRMDLIVIELYKPIRKLEGW